MVLDALHNDCCITLRGESENGLDAIVYDEASQRLSIRSTSPFRFLLTVDDLDVVLKIREPRRRHG